jgi:hypothetical protein
VSSAVTNYGVAHYVTLCVLLSLSLKPKYLSYHAITNTTFPFGVTHKVIYVHVETAVISQGNITPINSCTYSHEVIQ